MEKHVHLAVVNYIKLQYPHVIFRSDTGAGMKLSIGQAKAQKAIQNGMAWPDLFIAEPKGKWQGMFIELKNEGFGVWKVWPLCYNVIYGNLAEGLDGVLHG